MGRAEAPLGSPGRAHDVHPQGGAHRAGRTPQDPQVLGTCLRKEQEKSRRKERKERGLGLI